MLALIGALVVGLGAGEVVLRTGADPGSTASGSLAPATPAASAARPGPTAARPTPTPARPTPTATATRRPSPAPAQPATVHVLALGDSVTDGTNCGCVPFPQLYAAALRDRYPVPVKVTNDGLAGATSADVLDRLRARTPEVGTAEVVVITIGANDFADVSDQVLSDTCGGHDHLECAAGRLVQLRRNLDRIVARVKSSDTGSAPTVLLTGYWNVYEDGNVAEDDYSAAGQANSIALTRAVNRVVTASAADTQATYVDLFGPFKGADGDHDATPLLADDGDHPNAVGHRVIAQALLAAGLPGVLSRAH